MRSENEVKIAPSLYKQISEDLIKKINTDPFCIKNYFWINRVRNQKVPVILTSKYLLLCEPGKYLDYSPSFYISLDFNLKFQIIYEDDLLLHGAKNVIGMKKIGFRLLKEKAQPIEFEIDCQDVIEKWTKKLAQFLIRRIQKFNQYYERIRILGQGSSATVLQVNRFENSKHYALKSFSKQQTFDSKNISKQYGLINEIKMMRFLNHPNIIKCEEICQSKNSVYFVLELFRGGTLRNRIDNQRRKFSTYEIRDFLVGMAGVLQYMEQRRIMHRDIKPGNIMLRDKYSIFPLVIDLGLSANVDSDDYIYYECGSPGYKAPQIFGLQKGKKIGPICDVFSTGAIFYELLTNQLLFPGKTDKQVYENNEKMNFDLDLPFHKDFNPQAMNLLKKMLKIDPKERITPAEMIQHPYLKKQVMQKDHEKQTSYETSKHL